MAGGRAGSPAAVRAEAEDEDENGEIGASPAVPYSPIIFYYWEKNVLQQFPNTAPFSRSLLECPNISPHLPSNKGRIHALPICCCNGTRVLGDCKSNSPNNPKFDIGIFPNTNYWKRIIGERLDMLLDGDVLAEGGSYNLKKWWIP